MKRKYKNGTEKVRREPPVIEIGCELTLVRLALTRVNKDNDNYVVEFND